MFLSIRVMCLVSLASALYVSEAWGQPADPLEAAERAYREVDFKTQRDEARRALEAGNSDRARLAQLYRLLGIADAALDEREAAKGWFQRLLALDPDVELERALSPRLRSPYLEARGFWDAASTRLSVDIVSSGPSEDLRLRARDPLQMVARVRLLAMGSTPMVVVESGAPELVVSRRELAPHSGRRLQAELLDAYGNVVLTRALPPMNTTLAEADHSAPEAEGGSSTAARGPGRTRHAPLLLGGTGIAALGIGVFAQVVRENKALEWNSAACERSGLGTRGDQCAAVEADRIDAQRWAVISYSAGGALLAAALLTYFVIDADGPRDEGSQGLGCGGGPAPLGLACSAAW